MTEAEQERAAVVAWLRDAPFPWMRRQATLWERLRAAWVLLCEGENVAKGACEIVALKIERREHLSNEAKGDGA